MRTIFEHSWQLLRKNGYTVLEARNDIEALQVAERHDGLQSRRDSVEGSESLANGGPLQSRRI